MQHRVPNVNYDEDNVAYFQNTPAGDKVGFCLAYAEGGGVWIEWNIILTVVARLPSCARTNSTVLVLHRLSPVHGPRIAHKCR